MSFLLGLTFTVLVTWSLLGWIFPRTTVLFIYQFVCWMLFFE